MKNKTLLSLITAAAVTLGGATMWTNARFNAVANSNGNNITMGKVELHSNTTGQEGKTLDMGAIFKASGLGVDEVSTNSSTLVVKGNLPVKLSTVTVDNPDFSKYPSGMHGPALFTKLTSYAEPTGVIGTWWRHYKMAISITVNRYSNNSTETFYSRVGDGYDSIFDTIQGTAHDGAPATTGLNELLGKLETLHPGDVVTITTNTKFVDSAYYTGETNLLPQNTVDITKELPGTYNPSTHLYTLSQDEVNAFQGKTLSADFSIVATEQ